MKKLLQLTNKQLKDCKLIFIAIGLLVSSLNFAQSVIFSDAAGSGVILGTEPHVSIVGNPKKDGTNGSNQSLFSNGGAWAGYTINCNITITASTNKLYLSFYNPNGAAENQVQINFANPNQQWFTEVYPSQATNGWYERVIDLSAFIGETLTWLWIAPAAGSTAQVYMDNIYVNDTPSDAVKMPLVSGSYEIPYLDAPVHYPGIPLLTFDMAKYYSTEMNSEYAFNYSGSVTNSMTIEHNGYNALLKVGIENMNVPSDYLELIVSGYGKIADTDPIPQELREQITGVSFRAVSIDMPIEITLEAINSSGNIIKSGTFSVREDAMRQYNLTFASNDFKKCVFRVKGEEQIVPLPCTGTLLIDDIYLLNNDPQPFVPSANDNELITWLKQSSIRYFDWNYKEVNGNQGIVLERANEDDKVSVSGLGYALAIFILAEQEGILTSIEAEQRVLSILRWLQAQNWFDGSGGWHGFPHHYFKPDGTQLWPDVSTIDWAMCAAGIRVARQYYSNNSTINSIATELLNRAQWDNAVGTDGRIAMGFNGNDGTMNDYRWGLAFSEETEIIYLEALATGKIDEQILDNIVRQEENGFYPSWFGAGFTYNWLQLWTGPVEPYKSNSVIAFQHDATASQSEFGVNLMGLTACETLSDVDSYGFIKWDQYISNQGSYVAGAAPHEVIQVSPAPYGAALALPFKKNEAIQALREYVGIGYYHPLLGLPDNIRLKNVPAAIPPSPNWNAFDINIGPIALAIEQMQNNSIGQLFQNDADINAGLARLTESFNHSYATVFSDAAGDGVTLGNEPHVTQVTNPKKDGVNGSGICLFSDGGSWDGYTINCNIPITSSTNKLYISFYNPNGAAENQVQINFANPNQQWLGETYPAQATNGWYERVIDLSGFVGETLTWIWVAPSAGDAVQVYMDNIYLSNSPVDEIRLPVTSLKSAFEIFSFKAEELSSDYVSTVFTDTASAGVTMGSETHVTIVNTPLKDSINGSGKCLKSDGDSWAGFTINCEVPITDSTKNMYISFYNPGGFVENQVQINFATPNQQWLSENYPSEATAGWYERVIDLGGFIGDTLTWMWIAPTAGETGTVYMDNIYFSNVPSNDIKSPFILSTTGIIYDEVPGEGIEMGTEEHVTIVDNPLKDGINNSDNCLKSDATASWSGYTIKCNIPISDTMSHFYISLYNPEDALENQVQLNFATPNQQWLSEPYPDESTTGWSVRVIDLTDFIGDTLNWMWIAPTAGQTGISYMDNIYVGKAPDVSSIAEAHTNNEIVAFYAHGVLKISNASLNDAELTIFDLFGRMVQQERFSGSEINVNPSISEGIYIIRITEAQQLKLVKKLYKY